MWLSLLKSLPIVCISILLLTRERTFNFGLDKPANISLQATEAAVQPEQHKKAVSNRKILSPDEQANIILKRQLFGKTTEKITTRPESIAEDTLPTSSLGFVLLGTAIGQNYKDTAIIINTNDKKQDIYNVGDTVAGAIITKILRGKVILTQQGSDEILVMSDNPIATTPVPKTIAAIGKNMHTSLPPLIGEPVKIEQMDISELERNLIKVEMTEEDDSNENVAEGETGAEDSENDDAIEITPTDGA